MIPQRTLQLNLRAQPFEVMLTGEKQVEYRLIKKWMNTRLFHKDGSPKQFDEVRFTLAYGARQPYFNCKFRGLKKVRNVSKKYTNGLEVKFRGMRWAIQLGEITKTGNIKFVTLVHQMP